MNQTTKNLFTEIEAGTIEIKSSSLLVLTDDIEFAHFDSQTILEITQRLLHCLTKEIEWKIIQLLFRAITVAYMGKTDLSSLDYEPLINNMENEEPKFINGVLYLLSITYDKKYIPVVAKYTEYRDASVRQEAIEAMVYLNT